jgi:xanthine dehydrogenase small subunit
MAKTRKFVYLQVNQQVYHLSGADLLSNLSSFLREKLHLTATKTACEEGDCGACTVLMGTPYKGTDGYYMQYQVVNSCIIPLFSLDARHIISLEGLNKETLSLIQQAMLTKGGIQCGFCTSGMIISLVDFFESEKTGNSHELENSLELNKNKTKALREKLKGNLCRCTGYQPILNAALSITKQQYHHSSSVHTPAYAVETLAKTLYKKQQEAVFYQLENTSLSLWIPVSLKDALSIKNQHKKLQLCAGTSDLSVVWNKAFMNPGLNLNKEQNSFKEYLSLHKISSLYKIEETGKEIKFGAQVSLQQIENYLNEHKTPAYEAFCRLLERFASPQIKNRATLTGNVANASPVGDTIPFLMVMEAKVELQQLKKQRLVKINAFYKGYKRLVSKSDEIITGIIVPKFKKRQQCFLYKISQRYDVDISSVSAAFFIKLSKAEKNNRKVQQIRIAFGGIAPCVIRLYDAEKIMQGQILNKQLIEEAMRRVLSNIKPFSDIRGSEIFRRKLVENLFYKFYFELEPAEKI